MTAILYPALTALHIYRTPTPSSLEMKNHGVFLERVALAMVLLATTGKEPCALSLTT